MLKMPNKRNTHQNLVPVWYSVFMTNGWNTPIITKVQTAIRRPVKYKNMNNTVLYLAKNFQKNK